MEKLGELRPLAPSYLTAILEFILTALASHSFPHQSVPADQLVDVLEQEHEVKGDVTRQVMGWFGESGGGRWKMDIAATVKEVGLGILRTFKVGMNYYLLFFSAYLLHNRMNQYRRMSSSLNGNQ